MIALKNILNQIETSQIIGDDEVLIKGLAVDSRLVQKDWIFIATKGTLIDGHLFIESAIEQSASVVICESLPAILNNNVVYVQVKNTNSIVGELASNFYNQPSRDLKIVGVTGTNGKTTVATLLFQTFQSLGYSCGLISTVQNQIEDEIIPSTHTTPDPISLHGLLAKMKTAGCAYVFMEVSSHAIHQNRIGGIQFAGSIFTNITHDHLDYHKTFDEYINVKKQFFDNLSSSAFALTNIDDKRGAVMLQNTKAAKHTYSIKAPANFKGKILENNLTGLVLDVNGIETHFRLVGSFNAYNILAVYGATVLLGQDKLNTLAVLSNLVGAKGRFETIVSKKTKNIGIVDYAHTPDALLNVIATINQFKPDGTKLITVIGCGGDRDKTKRPIMAEIATEHSELTILTSDNPRTEDPNQILNEMEAGVSLTKRNKVFRVQDRKEAIKMACALSSGNDIILIAGKGHENYQEINGLRFPFDDKTTLIDCLELLEK